MFTVIWLYSAYDGFCQFYIDESLRLFYLEQNKLHFFSLKGHVGRILNITSSPDGVYVATAGSDETLRLWKCFEPDVKKSSSRQSSKKEESSRPRMNALR